MIEKKTQQALRLASAAALFAVAGLAQAAGQTVAKDPETGALRAPTAAEAQALQGKSASGRQSAAASQPRGLLTGKVNPAPVYHRDGTVEQELDESSQSFSVAVRNADGGIDTACVTGAEAAQAIVKGKKSISKTAKVHAHEHK